MRVKKAAHLSHPWRVHQLARDFRLLDVWEYPIEIDQGLGEDMYSYRDLVESPEVMVDDFGPIARALVSLREHLGKRLGLDRPLNMLPIPGCKETSLRDRLPEEERRIQPWADPGYRERPPKLEVLPWRVVYEYDNESLLEVSNRTVHVLLHVGWVPRRESTLVSRLAVYVKPRGVIGRLYMGLINPFRRWCIYPAVMQHAKERWQSSREARLRRSSSCSRDLA